MVDVTQLAVSLLQCTALAAGFIAMVQYGQSQALVMPLVAAAFLVLAGPQAAPMLSASFLEFGAIAMVFTAIAISAHQIERAGFFELVGARLGGVIGEAGLRYPRHYLIFLSILLMIITWATAGLMHNITSIMVMTPIIIAICRIYRLGSRWLLCGALVASNLGGFSTAWGDTPNIIEARIWGLTWADFSQEILPLNFVVVILLSLVVAALIRRDLSRGAGSLSASAVAYGVCAFDEQGRDVRLDWRLLWVGAVGLIGFIVLHLVRRDLEIAVAAGAILFAVLFERRGHRLETLESLGLEVYITLLSVFVIAHGLSHSIIGEALHHVIAATGGAPWAVALTSYVGTGLTEAASWAAAVAPIVHDVNPSRAAAWALGAGICAGSSSLLTAASAGIILWTQSAKAPGHEITFRTYLPFGAVASLAMLLFYIAAITALSALGAYA